MKKDGEKGRVFDDGLDAGMKSRRVSRQGTKSGDDEIRRESER
jgi:hypothetical protein